jgi:hypothetical protein
MDALVWKIGDVKVTRVAEIEVERPLSLLFPDFEPAVLQDHPWLTSEFVSPGGLGRFSVHSYVLESGRRRLQVAAGGIMRRRVNERLRGRKRGGAG